MPFDIHNRDANGDSVLSIHDAQAKHSVMHTYSLQLRMSS
jgi:hypothetical protein